MDFRIITCHLPLPYFAAMITNPHLSLPYFAAMIECLSVKLSSVIFHLSLPYFAAMLASLQLSGILEMATPISSKAMASRTKMAVAENDMEAATHLK